MPHFFAAGWRWLIAGWLLTLSSSFGQTFFVSLFVGEIQAELGLSAGLFGTLYSTATLASATCLMFAGRIADRARLRSVAMLVILALAVTATAMALIPHPALLVAVLFGLRFFGQGLMIHIAMTGMVRWFPTARGKAVAIAALGHPTGEALLPTAAVLLIGLVGWRWTWGLGAAVLLLVSLPAIGLLLRREPTGEAAAVTDRGPSGPDDTTVRHWTRAEVLRDPLFYALQPGVLAPPFVLTAIWFSQVPIMAAKGLPLEVFASFTPLYAATTVAASLAAGVVIDRVGARRVLPIYLLPMAASAILIGHADEAWMLAVALILAGMTAGGANTLLGALWAELYGTRHLGAVRGLATSGLVFASALSPALVGLLADGGIGVETTLTALGLYSAAAAALMVAVARRVGARRLGAAAG